MTPTTRWRRTEDGSATTELTLLVPLLIVLLLFVAVVVHRGVDARLRLDDAAHQAARAASLQRTQPAAVAAADTVAHQALADAGVVCEQVTIDTDGDVDPGDLITVTVSCRVDLGDALLLGAAHTRLSATAVEPIDTYRSRTPGSTGSRS